MPIPPEIIAGGVGGFAFAIWVVRELWNAHKASDQRETDRADRAEARLEKFLAIIDEKTESK